MTILNSQFDVISHDPHKNALAGLMTVLAVDGAPGPYSSLPAGGTPVAGDIAAGTIVKIHTNGKAIPADSDVHDAPQMFWVTLDGDQDYDGAFVHKITCLQGGGELQLDTINFVADTYTPGDFLMAGGTANKGKFVKAATTGNQIYGMVGQDGYDATKGTLHVIIPQGIAPAVV